VAFKSINPHNPYEVIGEFEEAGPYDVEIAVVRAREAYSSSGASNQLPSAALPWPI
jgi:hypothetical protein